MAKELSATKIQMFEHMIYDEFYPVKQMAQQEFAKNADQIIKIAEANLGIDKIKKDIDKLSKQITEKKAQIESMKIGVNKHTWNRFKNVNPGSLLDMEIEKIIKLNNLSGY